LIGEKTGEILGARVGLITNSTGVDEHLRDNLSLLIERGVKVEVIFSPEHGLHQTGGPGERMGDGREPRYGIPILSLYGRTRKPSPEMLSGLGLLIYDIQDVGARFFTYISTMFLCMEAASDAGLTFMVLDRPNPVTGSILEGPILKEDLTSFVGMHSIPIRYGLTPGELARLYRREKGLDLELRVIPMEGWRREMWFDQTGLQWVMPSPNMSTPLTAILYPGMCLLEGTNLSEGRGTTRPFELLGAPWIDPYLLVRRVGELNGALLRPCFFKPAFSKYRGEVCGGAQIHLTDRSMFRPVEAVLKLLETIKRLYPDELIIDDRFDLLCGVRSVRRAIEEGDPVEGLIETWNEDLKDFRERSRPALLY
jgi:uncharacterized protein YbbC (DUF1343 family)